MRKIAITTAAGNHLPFSERLCAYRDAGFDSLMLWLGDEGARELFMAKEQGFTVVNCHAQTLHANALWKNGDEADAYETYLTDSLDLISEFGVPILVVHISKGAVPPLPTEIGLARLERLAKHARSVGVKLALENLHVPDLLNVVMARLTLPSVGFCFDVGHHHCWTPDDDCLGRYADRLLAIHLHDNDGSADSHLLPGDGTVDFAALGKRLREIGYDGAIGMETEAANDPKYAEIGLGGFLQRSSDWGRGFAAQWKDER